MCSCEVIDLLSGHGELETDLINGIPFCDLRMGGLLTLLHKLVYRFPVIETDITEALEFEVAFPEPVLHDAHRNTQVIT